MPKSYKPSSADTHNAQAASEFAQNMTVVSEKCQEILKGFLSQQGQHIGDIPFDPLNVGTAFMEYFSTMARDPAKVWEKQLDLWQNYVALWQNSAERLLGEEKEPFIAPDKKDRRFKDEAWEENAVFDFIKQSYLLTAQWLQQEAQETDNLDPQSARKIDFYTRQFVDAISPSNFLMTNPEVLKATIDSKGENLVNGLKHLLKDLERGDGNLRISMTDMEAFELGKNIATTDGKVIYQSDLFQLIQYEPVTDKVYKTPLLIVPAWINKYYIFDLQEKNSAIKWLTEQGYTVFIISWVNPDEQLSKKSFEHYMSEGTLEAIDAIEEAVGESEVSIMAYCLGGTLTATTLAWLHAKKLEKRVKSVTYLTTLVDFADAGELSVFVDDEQLQLMEERMAEQGYLEGSEMAMTFSMLRANDLIWSFVVNNYLLGKDPFPFDLLYWNADSTRMPATMHSFFLRNMYQKNMLSKPGGLTIAGEKIDLRTITTPSYILSTREDHIAPWKSTYVATQLYKGPVRFVLASSGHVAGVINPPSKNKYCYWTNDTNPKSPETWLKDAKETAGSWWPDYHEWQKTYAGSKVPARKPGSGTLQIIENAPGSYVKVMS